MRDSVILRTVVALALVATVSVVASPAGAHNARCGNVSAEGFNVIISDAAVIRGTAGNDLICGGPSANKIFGLGGNDVIYGLGGADRIVGGFGADVLDGGTGPDAMLGEHGNDRLFGGQGNDRLLGGPGKDVLHGGRHNDVLLGGWGEDQLFGENGGDTLRGAGAADVLDGGDGNDTLIGAMGDDRLDGGAGDDQLFGGNGADRLQGDDGNDMLTAGNDDDFLFGGEGDDRLRGGAGDDNLLGAGGNDALNGGPDTDTARAGTGIDQCLNAELVNGCENIGDNIEDALTGFGVTDDSIRVGMSADLSGPFSGLTSVVVSAQTAYFDRVNEQGGIAGRQVELVVYDNAYDVPTQLDNYVELSEESDDGVVMISHSTGSPHTAAIAGDLVEDDLIALPLSWYSGWATDFGSNVMEMHSNYCFEAMNGVEFLVNQSGLLNPKLAIVTRPGEYGQDGAVGARIAAETLGIEVVDLEASIAGDDFTPIVSTLIVEQPDIVWITSSPGELAQIFGGAAAGGLTALWSGNSPSYNVALLDTPVAPALDAFYFHSTYSALWGANESPGMIDMMDEIMARNPGANYAQADTFVIGWTQAMATEAMLRRAFENGDLTRAGVVAAANQVEVEFQGLAPNQSWNGPLNNSVVRGTYIYDVVLADATVTTSITEPGSSGLTLIVENAVGDVAAGHDFSEACFISGD